MKTLNAHTPSPWHIHKWQHVFLGEKIGVARAGDSRKSLVCEIGPTEFSPDRGQCEANARLIAAAPDLLAALQKAEKDLRDCQELLSEKGYRMAADHLDLSILPARAAIAKAV